MKTIKSIQRKQMYFTPKIECIKLDNEISLALQSAPPGGPNESLLFSPENFNNNPLVLNT